MPAPKIDPMHFASNAYYAVLNRPLRITDPQIYNDPALNPRWTAPGARTIGDETPEEWAQLIFSEMSTDRLYEILDGHYLLLIDGQVIHRILIERGAWDESRIGTTSTFVPWNPVLPSWMPDRLVHSSHYDGGANAKSTTPQPTRRRSAA